MKLYWKDKELTKQSLTGFSINELYKIKQSLAPLAYDAKSFKDVKLQILLLVNNEISRKLISSRKDKQHATQRR